MLSYLYFYYHIIILTFPPSLQKLEWECLSIDLLPHSDMFTDANLDRSEEGANLRDEDAAKQVLFGCERFIEGKSGEAYVTNIVPPISFNEYSVFI